MKYNMNILEKDLANGLHVILVEKPDYKKSLFMLGIPCGGFDVEQNSSNKKVRYPSGCAHFLEHQMFRLNGNDVTDDFARLQASSNAFTSYTETAYYFQTTSDVEKPLSLLLDFVENLDIDTESIEKEKGIILSEYHMYEQNPEQRLLNNTWKALYKNHPFKIDILGTAEDIQNMSVETLTSFYKNNYDPSRMVLVGVTGKNVNSIMETIENHQKNVPSNLDGFTKRYIENEPKAVVHELIEEEMDITTPYVCVAFKLDPCDSVQHAMLADIALQIRLDSLFSALNEEYQTWMDERIISQISFCECDFNVDHGYLLFATQTKKVDAFIDLVNRIVSQIKEEIQPDIFKAIQIRMIAQNIRGLDNFDGLAIDLMRAHFEKYSYFDSLQYIEDLNPKKIQELCNGLDFSNKAIIKIMPKGMKSSNLMKSE